MQSSGVTNGNVVALPFSRERYLIAQSRRDCEAMRQSILTVQRCLRDLEEVTGSMDDRSERERLQSHVAELHELLLLRLDQLSRTDLFLQEALGRT